MLIQSILDIKFKFFKKWTDFKYQLSNAEYNENIVLITDELKINK